MIHFGWIWKDCEIKAAMMRDEAQRLEVSEELRSSTALAQLRNEQTAPKHLNFAGNGKRSLPYSYRNANEYHKRHDWNPFRNVKTSYFLAPASLAALAWVWVVCSRDGIFGTPDLVWQILIIAALVLFALEFFFYVGKMMFHPRHMMWEWEHPIYRSTFLAIPLVSFQSPNKWSYKGSEQA
jgi:hypothetical protein